MLLVQRSLSQDAGVGALDRDDASGNLLVASLVAGMAIAALFGWRRSHGVENMWQRGVVAVLAVFGALLVAFLFAIPARQLLGTAGLILLAVAAAGFGVAGSRWAVRGNGARSAGTGS